ncbi:major capsid protein [Acinetobacter baumannii]
MPLLREEAAKLSNNQLVSGVVEEIIDKDEMFAFLPFVGVKGKAYVYNREKTLADADFLDPNEEIKESASTFEEVTAKLRILAGDVDIDKFLDSTMDDTNNQMAIQVTQKAKGVGRKFHKTLAAGDASVNPKEFDGIAKLVTEEQTISAGPDGGGITLALLDELLDKVPHGADCLVMRRGTIRAYRNLLRVTSGTDAVMQMVENFGRPMLTHNGVPIVMNEFLPADEVMGTNTKTCSIYAIRANEVDGLHGIYGGGPAGIVVENIGTVQNKDATRIRLKWYVGLVLKSTKSLARLKGVTNI